MMHLIITSAIFVFTLLLILIRPVGLNEAWATVLGGSLMLAFRQVSLFQAIRTIEQGSDVLLFLFGLLILSDLLRVSGFFDWSAITACRAAKGNGRILYRNVFLLGALTTAFLSLDTTAVILTPIVLSIVSRLKLKSRPYLITCAFVANTGSLLLPVSNLTNLLYISAFHLNFARFTLTMAGPELSALAVNFLLFRFLFSRDLPNQFEVESLGPPSSAIPDLPFFRGALIALTAVMVGYFCASLLHVQPFVVAIVGAGLLVGYGVIRRRITASIFRELSWPIFPFVIGLFVVVRGIENIGLTTLATHAIAVAGHLKLIGAIAIAGGTAVGSNIINNIPMALLSITALNHGAPAVLRYASLVGCDIGPNLTVAGSLATMLVITSARKYGQKIEPIEFFKIGLLVSSILALWFLYPA
jgi:arsenical pump membrane protein